MSQFPRPEMQEIGKRLIHEKADGRRVKPIDFLIGQAIGLAIFLAFFLGLAIVRLLEWQP